MKKNLFIVTLTVMLCLIMSTVALAGTTDIDKMSQAFKQRLETFTYVTNGASTPGYIKVMQKDKNFLLSNNVMSFTATIKGKTVKVKAKYYAEPKDEPTATFNDNFELYDYLYKRVVKNQAPVSFMLVTAESKLSEKEEGMEVYKLNYVHAANDKEMKAWLDDFNYLTYPRYRVADYVAFSKEIGREFAPCAMASIEFKEGSAKYKGQVGVKATAGKAYNWGTFNFVKNTAVKYILDRYPMLPETATPAEVDARQREQLQALTDWFRANTEGDATVKDLNDPAQLSRVLDSAEQMQAFFSAGKKLPMVCQHWAMFTEYTCNVLGIPCISICDAVHMQNGVKLANSEWQIVDLSWTKTRPYYYTMRLN